MMFMELSLEFGMLAFRLGLGDKLSLACTEKKGRAQATIVGGTSVMLPTGMLAPRRLPPKPLS